MNKLKIAILQYQ